MPPKSEPMEKAKLDIIQQWIEGGVLENSGSKAVVSKKPKLDLALKGVPTSKPEGPPPLPGGLSLDPLTVSPRPNSVIALAVSPWAPLVAVGSHRQVLLWHPAS